VDEDNELFLGLFHFELKKRKCKKGLLHLQWSKCDVNYELILKMERNSLGLKKENEQLKKVFKYHKLKTKFKK
jgi:hypothetical protein